MRELLEKFENKEPEIVLQWNDPETEAIGWVVINSLRGGAAGGGTRMRKGLDKNEVIALAKTMEIKFTVSGPGIGGAKSGINFDPEDRRKNEVLKRWFKTVVPLLKNYYGTGGDLNIDELKEVIPITEDYGLWHPQEGVVMGHYQPREHERIKQVGQLKMGVSKVLEDPKYAPKTTSKYTVADMITGYGVAETVKHFYAIHNESVNGKRAIIQGWGNVAAATAYYLAKEGVKITGIIDRAGGLLNNEGYSFEVIEQLFTNKEINRLIHPDLIPFDEINNTIWDQTAEIFIPAAASRLLSKDQLESLIANGNEVIACGANVPFADKAIFYGPIAELVDGKTSLIPDFIANCGMARVFAYLLEADAEISDEAIFNDVSSVIKNALQKVHNINGSNRNITKTALELALNDINNTSTVQPNLQAEVQLT
ncbi:MAG: amino acid dehydrogenase [Bacteroidetes bacterium]|nr:amino acid dehydrogenase [Sphingobacteriaceae bacterium AH-315-L07]PCH66406.1 MAG: amino acid dehydrogenase [Bacteroidota bacterium]